MNTVNRLRRAASRLSTASIDVLAARHLPDRPQQNEKIQAEAPVGAVSPTILQRGAGTLTDGIGVNHAFVCINPPATLPAFRATIRGGNVVIDAGGILRRVVLFG